ncbi:unnamed protein product [Periconia digitata]|uniref:Uncharacterized protein n=1 Tax=Periconia digitata TaxID=1303443 RepID=A0A9W4U4H7_9PLEO|nr:unnamed protein product [Periconia digitata]
MARLSLHGVSKELATTITLLLLLSILIITLVPVQIIVPGRRLTNGFKVAYNIVGTVIATIIARYAAGEIQKQWLRLVNHEVSDLKYQVARDSQIAVRWRAILGISSFTENVKNLSVTGLTLLSSLATALITAAIVAAITLTETSCSSVVHPPRIHSGTDTRCMGFNSTKRSSPLWELSVQWDEPGYFSSTNLGCSAASGDRNLGDINTVNPKQFAYARGGVAVASNAIGAPEIFYTEFPRPVEPIERPYGHPIIETNLRSVSHCLPVMARNPVKCKNVDRTAFKVDRNDDMNRTDVQLDIQGCTYKQPQWESPDGFGIMAARLCEADQEVGKNAPNNIGRATVAIGATGVASLTLAASLGDRKYLEDNAEKYDAILNNTIRGRDLKYAVSCEVDVKPTIEWRTVTLSLEQGHLDSEPSYSKVVSGKAGCAPSTNSTGSWNIAEGYWANAAASLKPPLSEGRYWNGFVNKIAYQSLSVNETSDKYDTVVSWTKLLRSEFGFPQSTNALEDVLGLTAGIAMSQISTLDSLSPGSPLTDKVEFHSPVAGNATFACTRVGSGSPSALLFAVPPLLAAALALYLIFTVPRERTKWKTSRLGDIISIGMASERELNMAYQSDHKRKTRHFSVQPLHFKDLKRSSTMDSSSEDGTLLSSAAPPATSSGKRWVTDSQGTRAVPVRFGGDQERDAESGWTTAVPRSPVRLRTEETYTPMDGVR